MSKSKSKKQESAAELLKGAGFPEHEARRYFEHLKEKPTSQAKEKFAIRRQAAKLLSQMQPPIIGGDKAKIAQAENGLRGIFERVAKQKLPAHRKKFVPPGVWGTYTTRFTPPYTGPGTLGTYSVGQTIAVTGNPTMSASGVDNLGQMSCSVATSYDGPSSGTASNVLGVSFKPLFAPASVSVSLDSEISYGLAVNSIHNEMSEAEEQYCIELYRYYDGSFYLEKGDTGAGGAVYGSSANPLDFYVFSGPGPTEPFGWQLNSDDFYFLVIWLSCGASGQGWPGSLAAISAMITVPSITVTVTSLPISNR